MAVGKLGSSANHTDFKYRYEKDEYQNAAKKLKKTDDDFEEWQRELGRNIKAWFVGIGSTFNSILHAPMHNPHTSSIPKEENNTNELIKDRLSKIKPRPPLIGYTSRFSAPTDIMQSAIESHPPLGGVGFTSYAIPGDPINRIEKISKEEGAQSEPIPLNDTDFINRIEKISKEEGGEGISREYIQILLDELALLEDQSEKLEVMDYSRWKIIKTILLEQGYEREILNILREQTNERFKQTAELEKQLSMTERFERDPGRIQRSVSGSSMSAETARIIYGDNVPSGVNINPNITSSIRSGV